MFEVVGFCLNTTNNCSINSLIDNFTKNIFKLTDAANKIVEVIVNQFENAGTIDLTNLSAASQTFSDLGKSIGKVMRQVLGFNKTHSDGRKPKNPVTPAMFI